jgi:quercetin dioxygenase-like cupin family protein
VQRPDGAYVYQPGEAELRWLGDTSTYFLATGKQTGGVFALVDETANRGETVPLHLHADDVESFYVLDGEVSFFLGDEPGVRAAAGAFVHVPAGAVHGFRIESQTARYLILTTPRHGEFYKAISLPSRPGGQPPLEPMEGERIREAAEQYGIELVGPLPEEG